MRPPLLRIVCGFGVEADDVAVPMSSPPDRCVCLRCYNRATGHDERMRQRLRQETREVAGREEDST